MKNTMTTEKIIEELPPRHQEGVRKSQKLADEYLAKADSQSLFNLLQNSYRFQLDLIRAMDGIMLYFSDLGRKPLLAEAIGDAKPNPEIEAIKNVANRAMDLAQMVLENKK